MHIALYIEHGVGNGVGGAELMMARLASVWAREHRVELIHHRPPLTPDRLAEFTTDDLSRVTVRSVEREPEPRVFADPMRRLRAASEWHRHLSENRDVFIACTHWAPPFCHARHGVLLVLFPFYVRPQDATAVRELPAWKRLRHGVYHGAEWWLRMRTYRSRVAISPYTQVWTRRRWHIDTTVVAPPVDADFPVLAKRRQILSVGRFSTMAHTKKQLEMARTFRQLVDGGLRDWHYVCVGGLNSRAENHAYFEEVRRTLDGYPATVEANLPPDRLRTLFAESSLFWHATGVGDDTVAHPELAEHFGIAVVEAMASGCVPLVVNRGGPADLVVHGGTGVVWNTLGELAAWTRHLAVDEVTRCEWAAAARLRARNYSSDHFIRRMSAVAGVPLSTPFLQRMTTSAPQVRTPGRVPT